MSYTNLKARIIRGYDKGKLIKISQWCNDWFMDTKGRMFSPTQLKLFPRTIEAVRTHDNNGMMFALYELRDDGTFIKRK